MTYEKTPIKQSRNLGQEVALKAIDQLSTSRILWLLIKRHKVALLTAWAVTITILYFVPFAPDLIASIIK